MQLSGINQTYDEESASRLILANGARQMHKSVQKSHLVQLVELTMKLCLFEIDLFWYYGGLQQKLLVHMPVSCKAA